jgi:ankyrin repeat protein
MEQQPSHPLAAAAAEGKIAKVTELLKANKQHRKCLQELALQYAAEGGHEKLVKILLKGGATIDIEIDTLRASLHVGHTIPAWCPPTAVHLAAKKGHHGIVKILLEHQRRIPLFPLLLREGRWMSALHESVAENDIAMTKLMLENGVTVHYPDKCADCLSKDYGRLSGSCGNCGRCQGRTALHVAAEHGYEEMVRLLIRHGATFKSQAIFGTTPLHLAAQGGHDGVVLALLQNGWKPGKISYGTSPGLLAAQNGHKTTVDILGRHGGIAIRSVEWEIYPLIKTGDAQALEILLPHANNIIDRHTLQHMFENAATSGESSTLLVLLKYAVTQNRLGWIDYFRVFYFAVEWCELNIVQELVDNCPWTQQERDKHIPVLLFQAGCSGHFDSALILLSWSGGSQLRSDYLRNVLFGAIKCGHLSLIDKLLMEGVDLHEGLPRMTNLNIDGCAHLTLHTATHYEHPEVCQLLLDQGFPVDECDRYRKTALHYAVQRATLETINILLDRGAKIDGLDELGQTPLHSAARMAYRGSGIKLLLSHGVNVDMKDSQGRTPLHLAGIEGNDDIYKLLLDNGANPEAKDCTGWTASQHLAKAQARRLESN